MESLVSDYCEPITDYWKLSPNHPIRFHQRPLRDFQANLLCGLEVNHEVKLHRLLNRQIGGFGSF